MLGDETGLYKVEELLDLVNFERSIEAVTAYLLKSALINEIHYCIASWIWRVSDPINFGLPNCPVKISITASSSQNL